MKLFNRNKKKNKKYNSELVLFMAAYEVNEFKKNFVLFKNKVDIKALLEQFHILGISHDGNYITSENKVTYNTEFNNIGLNSTLNFNFKDLETKNAFDDNALSQMVYAVSFEQRAHALLDEELMTLTTTFNMEPFIAVVDDNIYQVEAIAFILNTSIIISFELIHFDTGEPLNCSEIYGRVNNLSILPVKKLKYFNQDEFIDIETGKRISDIIYDNIWNFFEDLGSNKWKVENYSYLHNILVLSNNIKNPKRFFQDVLGATIENLELKDLNTSNGYKYYAKEYMGLVVDFNEDMMADLLIDAQVLEAFKMYICLQLIIDYDIKHELNDLLDHQMFVRSLIYPRHVPIITINVIDNLRDTVTVKGQEEAIAFKIESLKLLQERKRNENGTYLNMILLVLTLMGSLQSLDILNRVLGIPFLIGLFVIGVGFTVLIILWLRREKSIK